jgi:hypothetical protein
MTDKIYGIHQSQPRDVFNFFKANAKKLGLVGRFSYLPTLQEQAASGQIVGLNNGVEMIIDNQILVEDELLMDGQTRRYAKVRMFMGAFGNSRRTPDLEIIEDEISRLGYSDMNRTELIDIATAFSVALGIDANSPYFNPLLFRAADIVEVKAGVPRYFGPESSILDAPSDGREYVRVDGEWVVSDHFVHTSIDGGTATI